ncbi:MAG: hypothetical protein A2V93_09135 [Ignavibacteria bacterium RBG_16_34_14]|nr:MAG: hypothetical protein A2V93_09135 [Ignavibacteria bacterium RBG_16_34_14]
MTKKMVNLGSGNGSSTFGKATDRNIGQLQKGQSVGYKIILEADMDSTRPLFYANEIIIDDLKGDTTLVPLKVTRYFRPPTVEQIPNKTINEDEPPLDSLIAIINAMGYDNDGNPVGPEQLQYSMTQSNSNLVNLILHDKNIKLDSLSQNGNGSSNIAYKVVSLANSTETEKDFGFIVNAMSDREGKLVDFLNNARQGYVMSVNANRDTAIVMTGANGNYSLQNIPTGGDTLKAHIINPYRPEAFVRTIFVPGNGDQTNVTIDAVPHLEGADYIGLDTLASFVWEGNFRPQSGTGMQFEGLKKWDLNNMFEIISSWSTFYGDTITVQE